MAFSGTCTSPMVSIFDSVLHIFLLENLLIEMKIETAVLGDGGPGDISIFFVFQLHACLQQLISDGITGLKILLEFSFFRNEINTCITSFIWSLFCCSGDCKPNTSKRKSDKVFLAKEYYPDECCLNLFVDL